MNAQNRWKFAGRLALAGAESGVIVSTAGVAPVLLLGFYFAEDVAAIAMLIAYGLLFGIYLARRLAREGLTVQHRKHLLLAMPAASTLAGYIAMRAVMGVASDPVLSAIDGIVFGAVAGLIIGIAMLRLPLAEMKGLPVPATFAIPLAFLAAGAIMGVVAGAILSVPLTWIAAIPVWQAGIGAVMGRFLALPARDG